MKIIFTIFIFCIVLFLYLHIQFHLKQSDDLEMYELDNPSKEKLEEICDLRQPVLFDFDSQAILETTNRKYLQNNYSSFDMKIRSHSEMQNKKQTDELYVTLPLHTTVKLLEEDKKSFYFTENNMEFIQETGILKNIQYNDAFIRPYMVSNYFYDILMGSQDSWTPLKYEINYRNYFLMTEGTCQIKLIPPKSKKYLHPIYDYENFEWSSPFNVWNIQSDFRQDFDKIKSLEFTLVAGKTLYIPAYWFYSIKFNRDSVMTCFKYRTYMNNLAISPYFFMYALQLQNIKRETSKKIPVDQLNQNQHREKKPEPKRQKEVEINQLKEEEEKEKEQQEKEETSTKIEDLIQNQVPSFEVKNEN